MRCEKLALFFDGELPPAESDQVRLHLADCPRCQRELHALMQLEALGLELAGGMEQPQGFPYATDQAAATGQGAGVTPLRPRRNRSLAVAAAVLVAAAAAALLWYRLGRGPGIEQALGPRVATVAPLPGLGANRPIEGRLSYDGADEHRPYQVQRAASSTVVEEIPLAALARLDERGEAHAIAAAHILMGSRVQAAIHLDRAREAAETAGAVDDADSDRALLALLEGNPGAALDILEGVLARAPRHPQALWNRALALRALGLPLMTARAFDRVAALGEPGWHEEARAQAERLRRPLVARKAIWEKMAARGRELMHTGAGLSPADVASLPGLARSYFYEAARTAPSRERAEALHPVARALDAHYGGAVLTGYLERIAGSDFSARTSLARAYGEMLAGRRPTLQAAQALIDRTRDAGTRDIELGVIGYTNENAFPLAAELLPAYRRVAEDSRDPWLILAAAEEEAQARMRRSDLAGAERALVAALPVCEQARMDFRCARIELRLGAVYARLHRPTEARRHLTRSWARAQRSKAWKTELSILQQLSEIASHPGKGSSMALARAYEGERALRERLAPASDSRKQ